MSILDTLKPCTLELKHEPTYVHHIQDDPDEEVEISAYERKLEMMRKRYRDRKAGIPGMSRVEIAKAGYAARIKRLAK